MFPGPGVDADRTQWTDERLDDHMAALRALPAEVAKLSVRVDSCADSADEALRLIEKLEDSMAGRDRRLHERIDGIAKQLFDAVTDRDREYRRNIVLILGPIALVALAIGAKVIFGIDLPHP